MRKRVSITRIGSLFQEKLEKKFYEINLTLKLLFYEISGT